MKFLASARRWRAVLAVASAVITVAAAALAAAAVRQPSPWLVFAGVLGLVLATGLSTATVGTWLIARSERRILRRVDRVESTVERTRAKASRHEYHQEQSLDRLELTTREVAATTAGIAWAKPRKALEPRTDRLPDVLFVTSNGGGMGHIARCAAVLRHSSGLITGRILTLSTAAETVQKAGFDVEYFPSRTATDRGPDRWRRQFTRKLLEEVSERRPDVVVFDGTWVYPSLTDVAEYADLPLVWLRRGLWRNDVPLTQVEGWRDVVTSVIVPADIAEDQDSAPEVFRDATWTPPASLAPTSLPTRESALAKLGLDPDHRYALVQLSGGNGDGSATAVAVEAIRSAGDTVPVVVKSPLLPESVLHDAQTIEASFPLVDVASAWDFTVTGAGYNSVYENIHTGTPGIYVPSRSTITDDQVRRARTIDQEGMGFAVTDAKGLAEIVERLAGSEEPITQSMRRSISDARVSNGANEVARIMASVASRGGF